MIYLGKDGKIKAKKDKDTKKVKEGIQRQKIDKTNAK
jgi:hypothetical protein